MSQLDRNSIDYIYKTRFSNPEEVKQLGWGSKFSQDKRFEILLEIKGFNLKDSVLDVGCGYGDLSKYVINYTGIDLRKIAIDRAKEKYQNVKFLNCDIFSIVDNYDWIFASGIFCFKSNWKKNTKDHIDFMYKICRKGCAFNFLSHHTNGKKIKGMKYAKISEVFSIINLVTNNFTIRNDYLSNDFTVYIYK